MCVICNFYLWVIDKIRIFLYVGIYSMISLMCFYLKGIKVFCFNWFWKKIIFFGLKEVKIYFENYIEIGDGDLVGIMRVIF